MGRKEFDLARRLRRAAETVDLEHASDVLELTWKEADPLWDTLISAAIYLEVLGEHTTEVQVRYRLSRLRADARKLPKVGGS